MRMPNSTEMSKEQKEIYLDAPLHGTILVTGPPGTGKTVIAFLRAQTVAKLGGKASVAMYNRVLSRYTSNAGENDINSTTLHKWVYSWWKLLSPSSAIDGADKIFLECPYEEKEEAKALGARWDRTEKKWYISGEKYQENKIVFQRWNPKPGRLSLPTLLSDRWQQDWDKILEVIVSEEKNGNIKKCDVNWGHLIIDEAQDFTPNMFETLALIMSLLFKNENDTNSPAITVFADENQRLQENTNSTIKDIKERLSLLDNREYLLKKNYRNSLQVAMLASKFYTGLSTGKPDLPIKENDLPILLEGENLNDAVEYIYRYAVNHENEEIGVITQSDKIRKIFVTRLNKKIEGNARLTLQSYSSKDKTYNDSDKMIFDKGGVITVINKQSCKGLEFDAVFLPELQSISIAPDDKDQFMMEMYVMISRARHMLVLMISNEAEGRPAILSNIPDENSGLLEYVYAK
jgi:DNA helicase II / ATP-dependent DNA helicase PcrA